MLKTALDAGICVRNGVGSQSGGAIYHGTDEKYFREDVITAHQGSKPST